MSTCSHRTCTPHALDISSATCCIVTASGPVTSYTPALHTGSARTAFGQECRILLLRHNPHTQESSRMACTREQQNGVHARCLHRSSASDKRGMTLHDKTHKHMQSRALCSRERYMHMSRGTTLLQQKRSGNRPNVSGVDHRDGLVGVVTPQHAAPAHVSRVIPLFQMPQMRCKTSESFGMWKPRWCRRTQPAHV
jgi:hypothetical protein